MCVGYIIYRKRNHITSAAIAHDVNIVTRIFSDKSKGLSLCFCVFFDGSMVAVCYLFILRAYWINEWETSGGRSSWLVAYSTAASGVP